MRRFTTEKWVRVSTGSFPGKPNLCIDLPTGLGQLYRNAQHVSDVNYRFDVREAAGESIEYGVTLKLSVVFRSSSDMVTNIHCVWTMVD